MSDGHLLFVWKPSGYELVEQEGLKLVSSVVDCAEEDLRVGMPLRVVFRAVTDDVTLPHFAPA